MSAQSFIGVIEMSKIHVINEAGERIGFEFSNILSAAIWCNAEGYAHPMLSHNRYHVRGPVTFVCPVPVAGSSYSNPIWYRNKWRIYASSYNYGEFAYCHDDYDLDDNRAGYAASIEAAKAEIDERFYDDQN